MEIKGTVHKIENEKQITDSFKKRSLILKTYEKYPQLLTIDFVQDGTSKLDVVSIGDYVEVGINLRGKEYTNKDGKTSYFNSINGWKISKVYIPNAQETPTLAQKNEEDLPF